MIPQRPDHVPQDIWELELPSILGASHPRFSDATGDGDDEVGEATMCRDGDEAASSSTPHVLEEQLALVSSPVSWSDLWNIPDETAVHTLSFALGEVPVPPAPNGSGLEQLVYDICRSGRCTLDQMAQLCHLLPDQCVAERTRSAHPTVRRVVLSTPFLSEHSQLAALVRFKTTLGFIRGLHASLRIGAWRVLRPLLLELHSTDECDALQAQRSQQRGSHNESSDSLQSLAWRSNLDCG